MSGYILGVSCFFHDSAACLLKGGEIVAAAQEERFTRRKHDSSFPINAINYCLEEARCEERGIDCISFYEKPMMILDRIAASTGGMKPGQAQRKFLQMVSYWKAEKLDVSSTISRYLREFRGEIVFAEHHMAHAASAFYPSPFNEAAVLTVDGVGEWATATICHGRGAEINCLKEMRYPNSLGLFYSAMTYFAGFKVNSGEYKLMGLAPFGDPIYEDLIRDNIIDVKDDGSLSLNLEYFDFLGGDRMVSETMTDLFGSPPRDPESRITKRDIDIAASVQKVIEDVLLRMSKSAKQETGADSLCLAGGVALNCVANGRILKSGLFENIWVQPASGDAGGALGAAFACHHIKQGEQRRVHANTDGMKGSFLGPQYSKEEILDFLGLYDFPYEEVAPNELPHRLARILSEGKIVGVLQGRMEYGPRALGARSIFGDPRSIENLSKINLKVKFRESFRPFAPAVLREKVSEWFNFDTDSAYMNIVSSVCDEKRLEINGHEEEDLLARINVPRSTIPAVTHVDHSARIQTVDNVRNPFLHSVLQEFDKITGVPVLINTSFNLRGEPIVCSPMDAYRCMMRSHIDYIILENILLKRSDQPEWIEARDWRDDIALD